MTTDFERDLETVNDGLATARRELLGVLQSVRDPDLDRGTRGGWPIRKVLEHTLQSEWLYVVLLNHLRERPSEIPEAKGVQIASMVGAIDGLARSRAALLHALEGVDEDTFYRLQQAGHEEYSVLSVIENLELHDREHAAHVTRILAAPTT